MKALFVLLTIILFTGILIVPNFYVEAQNHHNPRDTAIKIAEARVKAVDEELKGLIKDCNIVREEYVAACQMKQNNAISVYEYLEVSRRHIKACADVARMKARLEEAKLLVKYAEETGQVDLSLTSR